MKATVVADQTARLGSLSGASYVLELDDGRELHGDRLLPAAGRRPGVNGIGVETLRMAVAS